MGIAVVAGFLYVCLPSGSLDFVKDAVHSYFFDRSSSATSETGSEPDLSLLNERLEAIASEAVLDSTQQSETIFN